MSYRIEQKDIVISGFEQGIADSPYAGLGDMRNVNNSSIPGEVSVAFQPVKSSLPSVSGVLAGVNIVTGVLGLSSPPPTGTLTNYQTVVFSVIGGSLPTGIAAGTPYYLGNVSGGTAKIYTCGDLRGGSQVIPSDQGSGTMTYASVDMAQPRFGTTSTGVTNGTLNYTYFLVDTSGRVWTYYSTAGYWIYLYNTTLTNAHGNGIACFATTTSGSTLFVWRAAALDYLPLTDMFDSSKWVYQWNPGNGSTGVDVSNVTGASGDFSHEAMVGQDGVLYWCDASFIQSVKINVGQTFDPTNTATFTWSKQALTLPANEVAQCLGEISTSTYNILIGGSHNILYTWDAVSISATTTSLAETFIRKIISVNTNAYIFAGRRGNIYISNGAQAQVFKKVPDHLSGVVEPNFSWGGVAFDRNNIYFGIQVTDNAGTAINQYGGLWALNLNTSSLRLLNKLSYDSYAGIASVIITRQQNYGTNPALGYNLFIGWYDGSNGGVDAYDGTPYQSTQAYVDSDIIPIGTFLNPTTPSQVEWKTSVPLVNGESITIQARTQFALPSSGYTTIGTSTATATFLPLSDIKPTNFEKAQWVQLRIILSSISSSPSYCRLTEVRIRDYTGPQVSSIQTFKA